MLSTGTSDNLAIALGEQFAGTLAGRTTISLPDKVQIVHLLSDELRAAVDRGVWATYSFLFDDPHRPFVAVLAKHHRSSIKWHWQARHRICRTEILLRDRLIASDLNPSQQNRVIRKWREKQPRYMADFPIWSRGHMKSTVARRMAIIDAVICLSYGLTGYCLYVGGTDSKTDKHAISIEKLLRSERMRKHAPLLTQVNRSDVGGRSLGWKATFFYTAAGYVFHFGSLQSDLAGGNIDDIRPSIIFLDDVDDRKMSPVTAEANFNRLTTEILPMGAIGTLTVWPQNFINRYSCMYRIYKGHARVLTNRRPTKPVPAIVADTLKTEVRTVKGVVRDVITEGVVTWPYFDLAACQEEINRMGLPAFMAECQHDVEKSKEGLMINTYDDLVHPISVSEFASVYGTRSMPMAWPKEWGNDWARTKTAKHANVAMWRTVSSQNSQRPGFTFYFHPMSFRANVPPADVAERVLGCLDPFVTPLPGTRITPQADKGRDRQTWADLRRDALIRANALEHTGTDLERFEFERAVLQDVFPQYVTPLLLKHHVIAGVNSHERDDIRQIYTDVYALPCRGVNPGKFGGIEQINADFAVDRTLDHPFRPGIKGYTRTFIVVPDDESKEPREINGVKVYPPEPFPEDVTPDDLHDDKLFRYQMCNCRMADSKITETGERIDEPLKMNDDNIDLLKMFSVNGAIPNEPLTPDEEYKMLLAPSLPEPNPETGKIVLSKQEQQQVFVAERLVKEQLVEKYGEELFTPDEPEGENWWDG